MESSKLLFSDYYQYWLKQHRFFITENTYNAYMVTAKKHIVPYFAEQGTLITEITNEILKEYYFQKLSDGLSPVTIRKHHANIHSALEHAKENRMIEYNPAAGIKLPKGEKYRAEIYSHDEVMECLKLFEGHELEICVLFGAVLGLRRSEVLGVQWNNIDFRNKTVVIRNTVVASTDAITGRRVEIYKKNGKSKSSFRTLVLPDYLIKRLQAQKQKLGNKVTATAQVCIKHNGKPVGTEYLSRNFKNVLEKSNLRVIRFHDLRHSCATTLFNWGYSLKDIQMWLGHSDIQTTADIYTHYSLENKSKIADHFNDTFSNFT